MSERERFSVDELKRVGWRIKSVRSLTGLNQEEFSLKSDISYLTLKGWELGRALPRQDGIRRILSGLDTYGIQVTPEWLIFGEGSGPYLGKNDHIEKENYDCENLTIEAFKKEQRKKGNNPIVVRVNDAKMSPIFNRGDILGGIIFSTSDMRSKYSSSEISSRKWLIPTDHNEWIVREIIFNGEIIYAKSLNSADVVELNIVSLGEIIWHYFEGEQI